jgi:nicotinamide-nucleotide amidase
MKVELLGVDPEALERHGAVSQETAGAMAIGARRRTGATYALSVTGAAGDTSPAGQVYVGLADSIGVQVVHRQWMSDRQRVRAFTCQLALDMLRRKLEAGPN